MSRRPPGSVQAEVGPCVYAAPLPAPRTLADGREIMDCRLYTSCTATGDAVDGVRLCSGCSDRLPLTAKELPAKFVDHLKIVSRKREPTEALRDMLAGRPAFLVCGGPSAKALPLAHLYRRGIWSMAVNNMAGQFRPNAFICADPPAKFHNGIWADPSIMKFVPLPKLAGKRCRIREKLPTGEFRDLFFGKERVTTANSPNVWGFARRAWMLPDATFFTDPEAAWGNHDAGVLRTGQPKTVCTLLLALRVLHYLGCRRVYLVGVDFQMDPHAGPRANYAFGELRDANAIASNNSQYRIVNDWLCQLQATTFGRFGFEVFNCNPNSGLRAFPHVPFAAAVADSLSKMPPEPYDLAGWYEKK